ncbi:MAG: hypothetical protein JO230_13460 [Xanthobacteraceae bacterium]|nr:hypothetical protein [Xanthobacteraceae bacterium]
MRHSRPEYLYFSPTRLSLVGVAGTVVAGVISGVAIVKAWPEDGIFPQHSTPAVVAAVEPERFYPVPEPPPVAARPSSSVNGIEATIPAPTQIIVDQGTPVPRRLHAVARAASNSHHRQVRAASAYYRRSGSYATSPGAWW